MKIKDRAKPAIPPVEPGTYTGICVGIIDLGEQYSETFKKYSNDVQIVWELFGETIEVDGEQKPRQLSRTFTMSTGKRSKLRAFIEAWDGKKYPDAEFGEVELFDRLGMPCLLSVVLSEDGQYSNIETVMGLPKGMPAPTTDTQLIKWDMEDWNEEVFNALPEWVQEKIKKSTNYQKVHTPSETVDFEGDSQTGNALTPTGATPPIAKEENPI